MNFEIGKRNKEREREGEKKEIQLIYLLKFNYFVNFDNGRKRYKNFIKVVFY